MRGRNLNMMAFILICGTIAYYDMKKCHKLPWPPRFIFAALTFLMMDIVTLFDETVGGVTAIGFVIAIFLKEGFVATCNESVTGTGQPQTVAFMGNPQPPSTGSLSEYAQGVTGNTSTVTPPGTTLI